MNQASAWRMKFAAYVAEAYACEPAVAAIMVSGSTGRGHADRYSDVDMGVFWQRPPQEAERQRISERIDAGYKRTFPFEEAYQCWPEDYIIGRSAPEAEWSGQLVEVGSYTVDYVAQIVADVLQKFDADEDKQNMIAGIQQGIALKGETVIGQWREAAAAYPDELAAAVVRRYGQIDHFWTVHKWAAHDNRFELNRQIHEVQRSVLHMLLAVNRVYYYKFKWLDHIMAECPLAPAGFLPRFRAIARDSDPAAAERLRVLVEEMYDLVEVHVPGVDVEWLRRVFRWHRPEWGDEAPPIGI